MKTLRRALDRRMGAAREGGFTLIELTVAMVITLIVVSALIATMLSSLRGVALSKQRQTATGLATGLMEQFRAVDYGTLSAGMYCADLKPTVVGHPDKTYLTTSGSCGAGGSVRLRIPTSGVDELLIVQGTTPPATAQAPIKPHVATQVIDGVTYTTAAYVSTAATTNQAFNLTALVSWTSNVTKGAQTVVQRSLEYSPSRCLSSATHPYSGACQAFFHGDAGLTNAGVTVFNPDDTQGAPILGLDAAKVELGLPQLGATLGVEQIAKLSASAAGQTAQRTVGTTLDTRGGGALDITADNDPSSAEAATAASASSLGSAATSPLVVSGAAGVLTAQPTTGDTGAGDVRTSSSATSCLSAAGLALTATNRPCSWSRVQPASGPSRLDLALTGGLPSFRLATLDPAGSPNRATVARLVSPSGTACPTATGNGCVTSQASRTLGTVALAGLPTGVAGQVLPPGWTGHLITVSGLQESAQADSGIGASAPSFTRSAGTVSYYDRVSGTVKTLPNFRTSTVDQTVDLGTVTGTYVIGGKTTTVSVSGSLTAGAAAAIAPSVTKPDPTCKTTACSASATPASSLAATLTYQVVTDGVTTTRFGLSIDLGGLVARSSYKAAFDA